MRSSKLSSRHKSSGSLIVLLLVLIWPRLDVSSSKANRAKGHDSCYLRCQGKLHLNISSKIDDPQVSCICTFSSQLIKRKIILRFWFCSGSSSLFQRESVWPLSSHSSCCNLLPLDNTALRSTLPTFCMTPVTKTILHSLQLRTQTAQFNTEIWSPDSLTLE